MEKEDMKYEQAVRELEEIVERMENDEPSSLRLKPLS